MWSTPNDMTIWLAYHMGSWAAIFPQEMNDILPTIHTPRMGVMALAFKRQTTTGEGHTVLTKSGVLDSFQAYMAWVENGTTGVVVLANSDYNAGNLSFALIDALVP